MLLDQPLQPAARQAGCLDGRDCPLRIQFAGATYQVTAWGDRRLPIFVDDEDRRTDLDVIGRAPAGFDAALFAYGPMGNHGPVVLTTRDVNLSALMRRIKGFAMPDAVLTGVETRTSSPLRIPRGKDHQSVNVAGLYPAGEGAGYAGGIMSAGVDGIEVAEAVGRAMLATAALQ